MMKIDYDQVINSGLSPTQYFFLLSKLHDKPDINISRYEKDYLKLNTFIDDYDNITDKGKKVVRTGDELLEIINPTFKVEYFEKIRKVYPVKEGSRRLHTDLPRALKKVKALWKYNKNIINEIIQGIENEKEARKRATSFMPGWKGLGAYITSESWRAYLDMDDDEDVNQFTEII